jgi:hypothetical protein
MQITGIFINELHNTKKKIQPLHKIKFGASSFKLQED